MYNYFSMDLVADVTKLDFYLNECLYFQNKLNFLNYSFEI